MASLGLSVAPVSATPYNLTAIGTQDWIVYPTTTPVRKSAGGSVITVAHIGSFTDNTAGGTPSTSTWSDGTPTVSGSTASVIFSGSSSGMGYSFTVPADTSQRTLTVLTGVYNGGLQITATLSDGSASPQTDSSFVVASGTSAQGVAIITYSAASAAQTLTVNVTLSNPGSGANANIQAAALTTGVILTLGGFKRGRRPRTHH